MHLTGDAFLIVLIVGAALLFLGRRVWRAVRATRARGAAACDSGCGCDSAGSAKPRDWAET